MTDALGDRMKSFYENRYRIYLTRRMPVIIRIDGNAFHTFTRGLDKPFDAHFMKMMQQTCLDLCKNIQGCVGGYVQSDEISLLLIDYQTIKSDAWFDYNLQKITSLAAARATMTFNSLVNQLILDARNDVKVFGEMCEYDIVEEKYALIYKWCDKQGRAMFDARAFNIPKEEVCNYFIWRQKDATRNSIQAAGQAHFSHKELDCKSQSDIQEMLFQKGINWNDYTTPEKRGTFITRWCIDDNMPILTENRNYIDDLVFVGE